jgi:farnesyl-diphosphate farnesyltransferase
MTGVLAGVSRSFYLTLRLLPGPMRRGASLGYLLARTSDTIADGAGAPMEVREECLEAYGRAVAGGAGAPRWPAALLNSCADPRERHLLERAGEVLAVLGELPEGEAALVREVVEVIIGGQRLDLVRFARATADEPVALADDAALEDYAWRVAGCVGAFWTKLGFLTMGPAFSAMGQDELLRRGICFGKGLQLVNILRDLPRDLSDGRCYLPVADPLDRDAVLACHHEWVGRARDWVNEGRHYAAAMGSRRLRAAVMLPAMIAVETLEPLAEADWERLEARVKVPRVRVYRLLLRSFQRPAEAG